MDKIQEGALIDDRYLLLQQIGEGGMGKVFKAKELDLERTVAIKFLQLLLHSDVRSRRRFEREAAVLSELNHPGIVSFYRFGIEESTVPYLVMEFIDGKSLSAVLREQRRLPISDCQDIAIQICQAMVAAHQRGILHRDLKPGNVIVEERSGAIKIVDFGLAGIIGNAQGQKLTQTGVLIGSLPYMSPEQCTGGISQTVDQRSDIYSLGCVLFEMVSGAPPIAGSAPLEMMHKHATAVAPLLSDLVDGVPIEFQSIVAKMLAKKPNDRYNSMTDVLHDLTSLRAGKPEDVRAPVVARRHEPAFAAYVALALVIIVMSGLALLYMRSPSEGFKSGSSALKPRPTQTRLGVEGASAARLIELADQASRTGEQKEIAISYLQRAIAAGSGPDEALACYSKLIELFINKNDFASAGNALNEGDAILRKHGSAISSLHKLEFFNMKSYFLQDTDRWKEILPLCDETMKLKDTLDDSFRRRTVRIVLYRKSAVFEHLKQYPQAIECIEEALNLSDSEPDEMHGYLIRLRLAAATGNDEMLKESFCKLKDTERLGADILYDAAVELGNRRRYDVALALATKAEQKLAEQSQLGSKYVYCLLLKAQLLGKQSDVQGCRLACKQVRNQVGNGQWPPGVFQDLQQLEASLR